MIVKYKNSLVVNTHYDFRNDLYYLYDQNDEVVDILSRVEFISNPMLRMLPNGRYRGAFKAHNSGSNNQPSQAGGGSSYGISPAAAAARTAGPGGVMFIPPGRKPMTLTQYAQMIGFMDLEPEYKPSLKRDGIIAGEIVGYRCWRIERGLLRSVYQNDVWLPDETLEGRGLEDWDHRGIHAWKDPASIHYYTYIRSYLNLYENDFTRRILSGRLDSINCPAMATGTVFLWGDVVEHQHGYRAEFARVRSIDWLYPDESMMGKEQSTLDNLRKCYGV